VQLKEESLVKMSFILFLLLEIFEKGEMRILWVPTKTNLDGKLSLKASQKSYVEDSMETELDLIFECL